jgi:tellurite resistance protein TehA-like permease
MKITASIESLHPGNFAFVMATGIISVGLHYLELQKISDLFSLVAIVSWLVLIALCLWRVIRFPRAVMIDLTSPRMVFSYFTLVASTDIVGLLMFDHGYHNLAIACWFLAFISWCLLLYLAFSVLTFLSNENNVNIMHGGWLITIVGTQSLVLLGAKIAPLFGKFEHYMMLEIHMLWGLGVCLYGIFVTLFCYRIFFLKLKPEQTSPLLWVVMGAAAISVNAGSSLLELKNLAPFLMVQRPFVDGVTLMLWSWATWWIPLLFLFGVWKHIANRIPLKYEPAIWSMVFPLGMYTVASLRMGQLAEFPPMVWIAQIMMALALFAWLCSFLGLLKHMRHSLRMP